VAVGLEKEVAPMFRTPSGEEVFVVDSHVHWWDASPENTKNKFGEGWINCFYDYHKNLSPPDYVWPLEKYRKYDETTMMKDLFEDGYVDMGIFLPTYLTDFYKNGFNTTERDAVIKEKYPDRFILNGAFDPRDGEKGLRYLEELHRKYRIPGVKLYTAEWRGDSKGWRLDSKEARPFLEKCRELGIKNIHVHKGPTIWPLNKDAFDVSDIDQPATEFPELNFIVEHCGLPRLEDFCWIAVQEKNVYGGLAVVMPFIHARPRYFAEVLAELLFWLGEDRLLFASDYALWQPKWIIEKFWNFELPTDIQREVGVNLTEQGKRKILGENAARLYGIDVEARKRQLAAAPV
jgi:predicted TIM-barrel fold metal-dependent hydrolase